ncbi:hypothetical protein H6P81_006626 [Aristolochia fimbriata]|uniref:Uncharacterized protein n=1 Tax=Aristolochia fimbriata TaxID=158543 RepID=A0AAV7F1P9_ARIFI|nr:hypothetical protein H6P81_006626 [Aristolochia fimbriata]
MEPSNIGKEEMEAAEGLVFDTRAVGLTSLSTGSTVVTTTVTASATTSVSHGTERLPSTSNAHVPVVVSLPENIFSVSVDGVDVASSIAFTSTMPCTIANMSALTGLVFILESLISPRRSNDDE